MEQQVAALFPANDGNERATAAERRSCRTSETTPGSPQECWSGLGGTKEQSRGCLLRQQKHLQVVNYAQQGPRARGSRQLMTGDSDLEGLRRDINQRASAAMTLRGETGPGCFVLGLDGSNVDEYKKSPVQWKPDLEREPL